MKTSLLIGLFFILFINIVFIDAGLIKGNISGNIFDTYGISQTIKGFVNISIDKISNDSVLTSYFNSTSETKNTKIMDLLISNGITPRCIPIDCSENLSVREETQSKTFKLNKRESVLLGVKISPTSDYINSVNYLAFNLSSNAPDSCSKLFSVDIMNDGVIDYTTNNASTEVCSILKPYGCFNANDANISYSELKKNIDLDGQRRYCGKVILPAYKFFKIGANISLIPGSVNPGNQDIKVKILDLPQGEVACDANITSTQLSCNVSIDDITSSINATVCIEPQEDTPYRIRFETTNPCGYLLDETGYENAKDYEIFAYPLKYKNTGTVKINATEIIDTINTRILEARYQNNCSNGCVIPINITAETNQTFKIDNVSFGYRKGGDSYNISVIGNVTGSPNLISLDGFKVINLDNANIQVPSSSGYYKYFLKYGDEQIVNSTFNVGNVPEILYIIPDDGFVLINTTYFIILKNPSNLSVNYIWKFGNSSPIVTNTSFINYMFNSVGLTTLTATIVTNKGNFSKSININVMTPDKGFNSTLKKYKEAINNFTLQIESGSITPLLKSELNGDRKKFDLTSLRTELYNKEETFLRYFSDEETKKIALMRELLAMKIPSRLIVTQIIPKSAFIQNQNRVSNSVLDEFGAGTVEEGDENFSKRLNSWLYTNLNTSLESKSYEIEYANGEREFFYADVKLDINPKKSLDELYFFIDGIDVVNKVKLANTELETKESKEDDNTLGVYKTDLQPDKNLIIQFLYPYDISVDNLPFYISPTVKEVGTAPINENVNCNYNGKCDGEESYKNCPNDCKPWNIAIILIIILIVVAVIVYILLQEWYKKYYESYLFTNKIQLFNLINYMNNASNQGTTKQIMFSKLKDQGWKVEQLDYAWKKFKGERVGMWEIPVFKWLEKKQVKKEIDKRNPNAKPSNIPKKPGVK